MMTEFKNNDQPEYGLAELLKDLRSKMDKAYQLKQTDNEQLSKFYSSELRLPISLLRKYNRAKKDKIEQKLEIIKSLNQRLIQLQDDCDIINFDRDCLKSEISETAPGLSVQIQDIETHKLRMQNLDKDEIERKRLLSELEKLDQETEDLRQLSHTQATKLDKVRPHIERLIESTNSIK